MFESWDVEFEEADSSERVTVNGDSDEEGPNITENVDDGSPEGETKSKNCLEGPQTQGSHIEPTQSDPELPPGSTDIEPTIPNV